MKPLTLAEYKDFWFRFEAMKGLVEKIATAKESGVECSFEGIDEDGNIRYSYYCPCDGYIYESFDPELLFKKDPLSVVEEGKARKKAEEEAQKKREESLRKARKEKRDRSEYKRLKAKFEK